MKNSIGGTWLLSIVLVFLAIFVAYICISINYSNAYRLKTQMVTVLEQYNGLNEQALKEIQTLMQRGNYNVRSACPERTGLQAFGVNGSMPEINPIGKFNYCVYREHVEQDGKNKYYYTIQVFLKFELPVFGDLFDFKVTGETNAILYPNDKYFTN